MVVIFLVVPAADLALVLVVVELVGYYLTLFTTTFPGVAFLPKVLSSTLAFVQLPLEFTL